MGSSESTLDNPHFDNDQNSKHGAVATMKLVNYSMEKDNQGLFDFECHELKKRTYEVQCACLVIANQTHKILKETTSKPFDVETLKSSAFEIIKKENYFKILPIYLQDDEYYYRNLLWLVVKTTPGHKYPLKERDIVRFGKQRVKVREIVHEHHPHAIHVRDAIKTKKRVYGKTEEIKKEEWELLDLKEGDNDVKSVHSQSEMTCRICLQQGQYTNPLISACKCTGSVKFIHFLCLHTWLEKKLNITQTNNVTTIKWTPLKCEMCQTHFQYSIHLDGKRYYTVDIPQPKKPYIVLEVMKRTVEYSKILHFVSFSQKQLATVGRKHTNDIPLVNDVTVSRHHASLVINRDSQNIFLFDNQSRFGTEVLIRKNLHINPMQRCLGLHVKGEIYTFQAFRGDTPAHNFSIETEYLNVNENNQSSSSSKSSSQLDLDLDKEEEEEEEESQLGISYIDVNHINAKTHVNLEKLQVTAHQNGHHSHHGSLKETPEKIEKIESAQKLEKHESEDKGRLMKLESVFVQENDDIQVIQA